MPQPHRPLSLFLLKDVQSSVHHRNQRENTQSGEQKPKAAHLPAKSAVVEKNHTPVARLEFLLLLGCVVCEVVPPKVLAYTPQFIRVTTSRASVSNTPAAIAQRCVTMSADVNRQEREQREPREPTEAMAATSYAADCACASKMRAVAPAAPSAICGEAVFLRPEYKKIP